MCNHDWKNFFGVVEGRKINLYLKTGQIKKGAFKIAQFGTASEVLFGNTCNIAVKQAFYTKVKNIASVNQLDQKAVQEICYEGPKQMQQ